MFYQNPKQCKAPIYQNNAARIQAASHNFPAKVVFSKSIRVNF